MKLSWGYLVLWSVADVNVPYETLERNAMESNFPANFVPQPRDKRSAWERATNLGARGKKVSINPKAAEMVRNQWDADLQVKLTTAIISGSAPVLIRHIERVATVPIKSGDVDKRRLATRQLDHETVAILEYDCRSQKMTATGRELYDSSGYVGESMEEIVRELFAEVERKVYQADGDAVRLGIRNFLTSVNAVLMSSGGGYFVPWADGVYDALVSCKVYLESLNGWSVTGRRLQMNIISIDGAGEGILDFRADLAVSIDEQVGKTLAKIRDEIQPVLNGERTENKSTKIRERLMEQFKEVSNAITTYGKMLGEDKSYLNELLQEAQSVQQILAQASGQNVFRAPAKRGANAPKPVEKKLKRAKRSQRKIMPKKTGDIKAKKVSRQQRLIK